MKDWKGGIFAMLLTAVLLFAFYSFHILNADHLTYGDGGDGYKNYYTLAYYLKYDHGTQFHGMLYPYGDNMIFSDCQPAVAWLLKPVCTVFPAITNHVHAIVSWMIFLSAILAALVLYKTFRQFYVDEFNAALFAAFIALLSPQIQRLIGHFSLGHAVFLPLLIYLLVRFFKTGGSFKLFAAITATITFFTFIHIYYMAMAAMYILGIAFFYALWNIRHIKQHARFIALLSASAVIPFAVLKCYLLITDPITDRPKIPWGFLESRARFLDIFSSKYSFTGSWINSIWHTGTGSDVYTFEGFGYIGFIPVITLALAIIIIPGILITKRKISANLYPIAFLLPAATVVLLFSMAFPFYMDGMLKYYDHLPSAIKQFRASGRFNWVFYYTATITSALLIYSLYNYLQTKYKPIAYILLGAVYATWFTEYSIMAPKQSKQLRDITAEAIEPKDAADFKQLLAKAGKTTDDFQCVLPLPFILIGSERIVLDGQGSGITMKTSLYSGLPMAGAMISRTSEQVAFKIANLVSDGYIARDILNDYKPGKSLLMLVQTGLNTTRQEDSLISKGKLLFAFKGTNYFELPISAFADHRNEAKAYFAQNHNSLFNHGTYLSNDACNNVLMKGFNDEAKDYAVFGKGAHYSNGEQFWFYGDTLPGAKDSVEYEISAWVRADSRRSTFPDIYTSEIDTADKVAHFNYLIGSFSTNTFEKWVRVQANFVLYNHKNKIMIVTGDKFAAIDEIMVRPVSVNVITNAESNANFSFNNYPIR